jgi:hypothetical protein
MLRWNWITTFGFALAVAACGPGDGPEAAANEAEAVAEHDGRAVPACEPSPDMPLEGRASPYDSATIAVGDGAAKVCYGRPSLRGREMIGGEAVPYGRLWRTGANEPTIIHVNVPARIAGLTVDPGSYSLYTIPEPGLEWTLIVNRSTTQWGHESRYTDDVAGQEVGRARVPVETPGQTVEQLTIRAAERRNGLLLEWQDTRVFIPVESA